VYYRCLKTLARMSEQELTALAETGEISYGDLVAARYEKSVGALRAKTLAALNLQEANPNLSEEEQRREPLADRIARQCRPFCPDL
jgi:hypothetical protein